MTDIIRYILIALCIYLCIRLLYFLYKRARMLIKIYSLRKECNAKISLHRIPFLPMWIRSEKPDITVEILDTVYCIRLYSGISGNRYVHFCDKEYSVAYKSVRTMVTPARAAVAKVAPSAVKISYSAGGRVRIIKQMCCPEANKKRVVRVLLFSPAPHEVSYVTEEKSTIKLAFTGDELYGYRIFTPSTFVIFADRERRRAETEKK